jgi:hypothetical protein
MPAVCAAVVAIGSMSIPGARSEEIDAWNRSETVAQPGVLLMRTGTVIEGRILKTGMNYEVQNRNGTMFVPGDLVSFQCANLREAYDKLHQTAWKQDSSQAHITLARWCITNQLLGEARQELDDALKLDPGSSQASAMLVRLEEMLDPRAAAGSRKGSDPSRSAPPAPRFGADEIESLGRLSRQQAQQFTRRIQPILVNNCALGGCHGADSETGFRLQRVIAGGDTSRNSSERNLAEVLRQIDVTTPRSSRLLAVMGENHGRHGKKALTGPRGAIQLDEIRSWVFEVAKSDGARERQTRLVAPAAGPIEQTSGDVESDGRVDRAQRTTGKPSPKERSDGSPFGGKTNDPFGVIRDAEHPTRVRGSDPFDPTAFNRGTPSKRPPR